MKRINIKTMMAILLAIIIATGASFAAGDMTAIMENIHAQQKVVNGDLVKINQQQAKIKGLCKSYTGNHSSAAKTDLSKAKADLKKYRADLWADDKKLMQAHKEHIKIHAAQVREEVKAMSKAQYKLDRDKAMGKTVALAEADVLMDARAELRNRFSALERARLSRDKDRWLIDKEYFDFGGNSSVELSMADSDVNNYVAQK